MGSPKDRIGTIAIDRKDKIMEKEKRFQRIYKQGAMDVIEIWVDTETGVNYIFHQSGYAGGLTPLLDREGKVVVSPITK